MRKKPSLKKILALTMCVVLTLTLLTGAAFAVETFTTSEECIAMIKEFEGFRSVPYTDDSGAWYIGYGTECEPGNYPMGVSEAEADQLLRQHLAQRDELLVNSFLLQYGVSVNQAQFDAMVSLTYNLGAQWINPEYRFCSYLINGIQFYSEEQIVNSIATWCHSGTAVLENLVTRRLREAFLFLYGDYEFRDVASRYCYIDFEPNGGQKDPSQDSRTVFYPTGSVYGQLPAPHFDRAGVPGLVYNRRGTADGGGDRDKLPPCLRPLVQRRHGDLRSNQHPARS